MKDNRSDEERRRAAERFIWREGDIRWIVPPHPKCVKCGSAKLLKVIYGLPAGPPAPGTISGGCEPRSATHACIECGHRFQRRKQA